MVVYRYWPGQLASHLPVYIKRANGLFEFNWNGQKGRRTCTAGGQKEIEEKREGEEEEEQGQQVNMCSLMHIANYQENKVNKGLEAFTTAEYEK